MTRRPDPIIVASALHAKVVVLNKVPAACVRVETDGDALAISVHPDWQLRIDFWPIPASHEGYRVDQRSWGHSGQEKGL